MARSPKSASTPKLPQPKACQMLKLSSPVTGEWIYASNNLGMGFAGGALLKAMREPPLPRKQSTLADLGKAEISRHDLADVLLVGFPTIHFHEVGKTAERCLQMSNPYRPTGQRA